MIYTNKSIKRFYHTVTTIDSIEFDSVQNGKYKENNLCSARKLKQSYINENINNVFLQTLTHFYVFLNS